MKNQKTGAGPASESAADPGRIAAEMAEEENIRESVEIALATVTKRRSNLRASAPDYLQRRWEYLGIDQIVSAMEIQNSAPFTIDKYFISDMAIMASRVWECFSVDPEGISKDVMSNAIIFT